MDSSYLISQEGMPLKCKIEIVDVYSIYGKNVFDRMYKNVQIHSFIFDL